MCPCFTLVRSAVVVIILLVIYEIVPVIFRESFNNDIVFYVDEIVLLIALSYCVKSNDDIWI
jgi:hypothetical protein